MSEPALTTRRRFMRECASLAVLASSGSGMAGLPAIAAAAPAAAAANTRLVLLGTSGGPRPRKTRSAPAQAVVVDGTAYLIDCGDGVARQMVAAGLSLDSIRGVFITHHHSDHQADFGNLLLLAWAAGLRTRVDCIGPPPLEKITRLFLEMSATDIGIRTKDEGRVPLAPLIHARDIASGGLVFEDERVRVRAALVDHPPFEHAFGYRFDTASRSIAFSGDTRMSNELIKLAEGADVLVHEVMLEAGVDRLIRNVRNARDLKRAIVAHHTEAEDVGRVAQAAGVGTLVLSHFVPAEDPLITDQTWIEAAAKHFRGKIVVGADLMEL